MRANRARRQLLSGAATALLLASPTACGQASSGGSGNGSASSAGLNKTQLVASMKKAVSTYHSAHIVMKVSGSSGVITARGDASYGAAGRAPTMRMTMSMPSLGAKHLEMRLVGGVMYLAIPPMTPAGKFVRINPKDKSNPLSRSMGSLTGQLDPKSTFDAFEKGLTSVKYAGKQTVQGEQMSHYVLSVDTKAVLAAAPKSLRSGAIPGLGKSLTYGLWLDGKNLMRRITFTMAGTNLVSDFSRWGEQVHVAAPPASALVRSPMASGA